VEAYRPVAESVDARYPLRLTTGRLRDQWHGLSRTGAVPGLFGHVAEPRLGMSPGDLARRALKSGDLVRVESRRGALHVIVEADEALRSGQAYLPMHWGKRYLGGAESDGVNTVTSRALDPLSRQPELKHAAVKVAAVSLPWRLLAVAEAPPALVHELQSLQADVAFASIVPIAGTHEGVLLRAAHSKAPSGPVARHPGRLLELQGDDVLRYDDTRRARSRRIRLAGDRVSRPAHRGRALVHRRRRRDSPHPSRAAPPSPPSAACCWPRTCTPSPARCPPPRPSSAAATAFAPTASTQSSRARPETRERARRLAARARLRHRMRLVPAGAALPDRD
jgi:hypothetical protein